MIVSDTLGIPIERDQLRPGGHRDIPARWRDRRISFAPDHGGAAVNEAVSAPSWTRAGQLAAELLEADLEDITVGDDGTRRASPLRSATSLGWGELAQVAQTRRRGAVGDRARLHPRPAPRPHPFGAHLSVVEVDTETGFADWFATSRSTTPARSSTRSSSPASSTAASRKACSQALVEEFRCRRRREIR